MTAMKNLGLWIFGAYIAWLVVTNRLLPMLELAWTENPDNNPHEASANDAAESLGAKPNGTLSDIFQGANILSENLGLYNSSLVKNSNNSNAATIANEQLNALGLPSGGSTNNPFVNLLGFGLYELQNSFGSRSFTNLQGMP
jgi:hypothetical protein